MNKLKWISVGIVGSLFAASHIGMIGYIATRQTEPPLPSVDLPVGPYTSYKVSVSEDGYAISYKANDPKTAYITKDIKEKGGFLGLANNTTKIAEEYFMDGQTNQGGAVSNHRSWLSGNPGLTQEEAANITAARKSEACIEAIGSAKGTGRLVGTSVGAAAAPAAGGGCAFFSSSAWLYRIKASRSRTLLSAFTQAAEKRAVSRVFLVWFCFAVVRRARRVVRG